MKGAACVILGLLAAPLPAQPGKVVTARFRTSPAEASVYQEGSSPEPVGRYLGSSAQPLLLDARGSQLRLIFRAPGFQDAHLTLAPGYFYTHACWPEQGTERLVPTTWSGWAGTHLGELLALGGLAAVLGGALLGYWRRVSLANWRSRQLARLGAGEDQVVGGYRLLSLLGEGGSSRVYRAVPEANLNEGQAVALKLMKGVPDRAVFFQEMRLIAGLSHASIVPVLDYGFYLDQLYLVLELVPGGTLRAQIPSQGLPWTQVREWLNQLIPALTYAHARGVVHGDLKPENLLLNSAGRLLMTDFGVGSGQLGTSAYLAPEQLFRQPVGPWTDQYGLGLLAYEMVTGRLPHSGALTRSLQQLTAPLPPPSLVRADLPALLDAVLAKMLCLDPAARYGSVEEAGQALLSAC